MPGIWVWNNKVAGDIGPDLVPLQNIANSMQIYEGDPVVWTSVTGSQNRVRLLTSTDISNSYVNSSTAGILGFAATDIATDSSGNFTALTSQVSLGGNVAPVYNIGTIPGFEPVDPSSGRTRSMIYTCKNTMAGSLWETTAVTASLMGPAGGLYPSTIGNAVTWFWSTAAAVKIARIVGFDSQHKMYNTTGTTNVVNTTHYARCPVGVLMYTTYDQYYTTNVAYGN